MVEAASTQPAVGIAGFLKVLRQQLTTTSEGASRSGILMSTSSGGGPRGHRVVGDGEVMTALLALWPALWCVPTVSGRRPGVRQAHVPALYRSPLPARVGAQGASRTREEALLFDVDRASTADTVIRSDAASPPVQGAKARPMRGRAQAAPLPRSYTARPRPSRCPLFWRWVVMGCVRRRSGSRPRSDQRGDLRIREPAPDRYGPVSARRPKGLSTVVGGGVVAL